MKLRGLLRERDVREVVAALKEIQPGLPEVGSFLATFQVLGKAVGKPLAWRLDTNYVSDNVRYRLPEPTVDRALEQLREKLCGETEEIQLDSDGENVGGADGYVISIEKIGTYTREQLEDMKWIWNLQTTCRRGLSLCSWLNTEVKSLVEEPVAVGLALNEFLNAWPYKVIPGFGFDIAMADLFCIRGSTWLNDDAMRAFSVFLKSYKNNATVMIPPVKKPSRKNSTQSNVLLQEKQLAEIRAGISTVQYVLVPINLSGVHWGCLVIDGGSKTIQMYDSMNSKKNTKRLKAIALEIVSALPDTYTVLNIEGPLQKDGDSCGVFACLHLWKSVSSDAPTDVSTAVFRSSESIPSSRTSAISSSSIASSLSSATDLEEERRKELNRSDFSLDERRTRALKMKPIQRGFAETTCGSHERLLLVNALPLNDSDDEDNSSTTRHLPYRKTMIHGRVYLLKNQWV
ncbi:hypothetical protein PR001_g8743 [Phytophthora rubi]|uniref:Ubiquitin-like protease family profile domain-containing protein n=1 Tax=Phytophthora rubi TaxID=129364 RepID=A0A6A3N4Q8_9STRA|nr:hypothetical protein PR001_g8743 [Phytophthora rubi]